MYKQVLDNELLQDPDAEDAVSRSLCHDRNVHPRSIHPSNLNRSNASYILQQGEYEGDEGFWVEDEEGHEGRIATEDAESQGR